MPLRPPTPLLLPRLRQPSPRPACPPRFPRLATRVQFHSSSRLHDDNTLPNYYEILQLQSNATPAEIKRQFFTLSKQHHPDHNPDDPTASTRFVAISEAYHVLSVPEKRAHYDHQLYASQRSGFGGGGEAYPSGSFSSASFAGSRPATGLNKKRGTFRGPPPSFYKSGGYGGQYAKRAEYAFQNAPGAGEEAGAESSGQHGGFGPGQAGYGNEVPHFDDIRHKQTHDSVNEFLGRRSARAREHLPEEPRDRGTLVNFLIMSGVLACIGWGYMLLNRYRMDETRRKRKEPS